MWLCFHSFPLLYAGREGQAEASTVSNGINLMSSFLTPAAMVDNLAEKVDECLLKYCLHTIESMKTVSAIRRLLYVLREVNGRAAEAFRIVLWLSVTRVPLYVTLSCIYTCNSCT